MAAKGKKVDEYVNKKLGVTVPIKLDTSRGMFTAEYEGRTLSASSLTEIKDKVDELVKEVNELVWVKAIQYEASVDAAHIEGKVSIVHRMEAVWVAVAADGTYRSSPYRGDEYIEYRTRNASPLNISSFPGREEQKHFHPARKPAVTVYMEYTEELWNQLAAMQRKLKDLQNAIADLLTSNPSAVGLLVDGVTNR